jgi:two-component system response regulator AtoC
MTAQQTPADVPPPDESLSLPQATEALERDLIARALAASGGNKSRAARLLDISERSLWYKIARYGF